MEETLHPFVRETLKNFLKNIGKAGATVALAPVFIGLFLVVFGWPLLVQAYFTGNIHMFTVGNGASISLTYGGGLTILWIFILCLLILAVIQTLSEPEVNT